MPELPEVETTLRGVAPYITGQKIDDVVVRYPRLRWPIPNLKKILPGQTVERIERRGKYILFTLEAGTLILHLGMSGHLRIFSEWVPPEKHDHVDILFGNKEYLRFTDPRRFGALLWTTEDPQKHALLTHIGPEPLTTALSGEYLWHHARKKKVAVKSYLMNSKTVAGVGNIYATEALFYAGIRPQTPAGKITLTRYQKLASAIKTVLRHAITKGGTTLKDFRKSDGSQGYFYIELKVYGRKNKPCLVCQTKLKYKNLGQRGTLYCPKCQQ